jgi:hypothetical protein
MSLILVSLILDLMGDPSAVGLTPVSSFTVDAFGETQVFTSGIASLFFSRDEKSLYVGTADGQLQIWDYARKTLGRTAYFYREVQSYRPSPDGSKVLVTFKNKSWEVHALPSGGLLWQKGNTIATGFTPGGRAVYACAAQDHLVRITASGYQPIATFPMIDTPLVSRDGRVIVVVKEGVTDVYRATSHMDLRLVRRFTGKAFRLPRAVSGDDGFVAFEDQETNRCELWNLAGNRKPSRARGAVFALSKDGTDAFILANTFHGIGYVSRPFRQALYSEFRGGYCFSASDRLMAMSDRNVVYVFRRRGK